MAKKSVPNTRNELAPSQKAWKASTERYYLNQIATIVDPEALYKVLSMSDSPVHHHLLEVLMDPDENKKSFGQICLDTGISSENIATLFKRHYQDRATIFAAIQSPEIIRDIAENSKNKVISCKRCDGLAQVPTSELDPNSGNPIMRDCPACHGVGLITVPGDRHSRKEFLELVGLGAKGVPLATTNVQINTAPAGSLEKVITIAQKAMEE